MNENFNKEFKFILTILLLNLNSKLSYVSIILLFFYGVKSNKNGIKAIIYSFLISQLNPDIFNSAIGSLRPILNLIFIFKILLDKKILYKAKKSLITLIIIFYLCYIVVTAICVSHLPLVSIFKGGYFTLGFLALYLGVNLYKDFDWIQWLRNYFMIFMFFNIPFMVLPQGYSTNGTALNGIIGNPNGLGIILAMAIAVFIYSEQFYGGNKINIFISVIMIFLTNSRTSILTACILLGYFILIKFIFFLLVKYKEEKQTLLKKMSFIFFMLTVVTLCAPMYIEPLKSTINEKLLKGQDRDEIFKSREGQMETFFVDYNKNKLIGVGFGVDGKEVEQQDYSLKLSYPVERGNIILAVLAETGNIGFGIFITLIMTLIYYSFKNNYFQKFCYLNILLISTLMVSIGEMTFFSGNSLGVLQWIFLAIYSNRILNNKEDNDESWLCNQYKSTI